MIGVIAGDIIGSVYEYPFYKRIFKEPKPYKDFDLLQEKSRFTDDTTMSMAIADALLNNRTYKEALHEYGNRYWGVGYGGRFKKWLKTPLDEATPYDSYGNGSAMRVSAVGWAYNSVDTVLEAAKETALPTHNHKEGIKGAQAVALAVYLARMGKDKKVIETTIRDYTGYDLTKPIASIRTNYSFDVTCQGSVPESICCFLESEDVEDAIRLAVSLGGDTDTMAAIAGSIAVAYYGEISKEIYDGVKKILPNDLWELMLKFEEKYKISYKKV